MQTRGLPAEGGNHIVTSVAKVYNELVKSHPKLIPILAAPEWPFDTWVIIRISFSLLALLVIFKTNIHVA